MRTPQRPLRTGYGARTTAREVVAGRRLDGIVAVVTGGYAGVGLETTRALAEAGARVVVPARRPDQARTALQSVPRAEVESLDLADPVSVDGFAARFLTSNRRLDLLVNNAGIMATPLLRDGRGFESQLATNHLGHFQLTARLWQALKAAPRARVISLSSRGHRRAAVDFEDPNFERRPYDKWIAYGQSKTANALFAVGLDARTERHGVRAFSVHPGAIITDLMRSLGEEEKREVIGAIDSLTTFKNTEQGAATSVWCAISPTLDGMGGVYCEDVDIAEAVAADFTGPGGVRPWATDPAFAEHLWTLSEKMTGVTFEGL